MSFCNNKIINFVAKCTIYDNVSEPDKHNSFADMIEINEQLCVVLYVRYSKTGLYVVVCAINIIRGSVLLCPALGIQFF